MRLLFGLVDAKEDIHVDERGEHIVDGRRVVARQVALEICRIRCGVGADATSCSLGSVVYDSLFLGEQQEQHLDQDEDEEEEDEEIDRYNNNNSTILADVVRCPRCNNHNRSHQPK